MSTAINWSVMTNDPVLQHPLYQKYARTKVENLSGETITQDIGSALASNEAAGIIAYLCWLKRIVEIMNL